MYCCSVINLLTERLGVFAKWCFVQSRGFSIGFNLNFSPIGQCEGPQQRLKWALRMARAYMWTM